MLAHPGTWSRYAVLAFCLPLAFCLLIPNASKVEAAGLRHHHALPRSLHGQLLDFTDHHGADNRIWSEALGEHRSLLVYLPPDFDPGKPHRVLFWFHAFLQDLNWFPSTVLPILDSRIAEGTFPQTVIVFPDGNHYKPRRRLTLPPATLYMDSELGMYETHVMEEIWPFVHEQFQLTNDRADHMTGGGSMGGGAAVRIAIRHRDKISSAVSMFGPLDFRYQDRLGGFLGNIPNSAPRTNFNRPRLPVARFAGLIPLRLRQFAEPLFDLSDPNVAAQIAAQNPTDMLVDLDVQPGELSFFVGYGRFDEYNFDAHAKVFASRARCMGLDVELVEDRWGRHSVRTAMDLLPSVIDFINRQWGLEESAP